MSVYVIAQGKVENRGLLDQYVAKVIPTIESHQGRVVAFDEVPEVVEGPIEHPRTVILEFPSMTAFHAWYDSPEYQEILPLRLKTAALQRNEHNSTMAQWTVIRQAIAGNRDIAELMTAGLHGERSMDPADQLRLEQMLAECAWAAFHIWDRTQRGVFPKGGFELTAGPFLCDVLKTAGPGGAAANIGASFLSSSWTSTPRSPRTVERPSLYANQSMKPTAPDRMRSSGFATAPCRG